MTVRLEDGADVDAHQRPPDATALDRSRPTATTRRSSAGGFSAGGLNVIVTGQTAADVDKASVAIVAALADQPDLVNLKSDLVKATPEVQVTVDPNKAITVGMTAAQVAGQVRAALVAQPATTHPVRRRPDGPGRRPARPRGRGVGRRSQGAAGRHGGGGPAGKIATVEQVVVQGSITRIDERPAASITAEITGDDTGAVSKRSRTELDSLAAAGAFPAGRPPSSRASASSRPRRSAASSPRWASRSCSST